MPLLIPFNVLVIGGIYKYCRNYNMFAGGIRNKSVGNLAMKITFQSIAFTFAYMTSNLAILGMNPIAIFRENKQLEAKEYSHFAGAPMLPELQK